MDWENLELEKDVKDQLGSLRRLMDHVSELRRRAEELHEQAKVLENEAERICSSDLPGLFRDLGVERQYGDGFKAELKHIVSATINKADRDIAYAWLENNDGGGLITTTVSVVLPRGLSDQAERILNLGHALGGKGETRPYVHPSTLSKWFRDKLGKGEINNIPDAIKVYNAEVVKFTETT